VAVDPDLAQWGINDTPRVPAVPLVVDQERSRIPRITLLTLVAGVTMVGSGFGMFELGCAFSGGRISVSCYAVGYSLAAVSALSLTPLSVWLTGKLTDGNGSYGWTLLGTAIGMAAGAAGALAVFASNAPGDTALIPLMIGPLLGSVFLYELSSDASREAVAEAEQSVRFGASVAPTDEGGMVNVVGTF
jgi:hypothetical protein